jgi:hypothetical protein
MAYSLKELANSLLLRDDAFGNTIALELLMDTTFTRAYDCCELTELPTSESLPRYYYPGASREGGRDGLLVEARPEHGPPWMGVFAFGRITAKGVSGVFTTPDPHRLCAIARGAGYLVSVDDPASWESVQASPIIDVRPVRAQGILVFAMFTELVAYGDAGLRWRTNRLTWDDLRITEVTETFIRGEFWDVVSGSTGSFCVDLATGTHKGGIPAL